nr:MAG TPA: hypothetical protein [Caudoviricetes sp.]
MYLNIIEILLNRCFGKNRIKYQPLLLMKYFNLQIMY